MGSSLEELTQSSGSLLLVKESLWVLPLFAQPDEDDVPSLRVITRLFLYGVKP